MTDPNAAPWHVLLGTEPVVNVEVFPADRDELQVIVRSVVNAVLDAERARASLRPVERQVVKDVVRDAAGRITHIIESEVR